MKKLMICLMILLLVVATLAWPQSVKTDLMQCGQEEPLPFIVKLPDGTQMEIAEVTYDLASKTITLHKYPPFCNGFEEV